MEIVYKRVDDLIEYEGNARRNDAGVAKVAESIREFGFLNPITIDPNNVIIAGHTRLKAAKQLGMEEVPCIVQNLSEEDAKLRRENAKAWLCTSSTADENGWANRVYFLQQKDGTLYLVMAAEQPENQNRNFVCWVFRLTEKPVPTYDSMEAYALSVINALKQPNGYTYYMCVSFRVTPEPRAPRSPRRRPMCA